MSILLIRAGGPIGETVARRLRAEGDEVRVVEPAEEPAEAWRELGVKVAPGRDDDADLIERAAQGVRTVVVFDGESGPAGDVIEEVVAGIAAAGVERVIVCARRPDQMVVDAVRTSGLDYVVLTVGRGLLSRKRVSDEDVAEAIDAADDLAGSPRLELDLTTRESWAALGLSSSPGTGR
jgi:Trk K+ transport system NAD-binding subunit